MAYDETLAARIRTLLAGRKGLMERTMFGGVCFLVDGNMCCGVVGNKLVVRVGQERYGALLRKPYARPIDFTGRPLRGFVYILSQGLRNRESLKTWTDFGLRYAESLPAKRK